MSQRLIGLGQSAARYVCFLSSKLSTFGKNRFETRVLRHRRRSNGTVQLGCLPSAAVRLADQPVDGAGAAYPAHFGSWQGLLQDRRRVLELSIDELGALEERTFRASRRAQNRAAALSLSDFEHWFSSLDSQGQ
eukprot:3284466-Pyramimonas_sp.AAC.1